MKSKKVRYTVNRECLLNINSGSGLMKELPSALSLPIIVNSQNDSSTAKHFTQTEMVLSESVN